MDHLAVHASHSSEVALCRGEVVRLWQVLLAQSEDSPLLRGLVEVRVAGDAERGHKVMRRTRLLIDVLLCPFSFVYDYSTCVYISRAVPSIGRLDSVKFVLLNLYLVCG